MARGGWLRRAVRWALLGVLGALAVVVLLLLLLRWIDPPASAFMLEARWQALRDGVPDYRQRYRWVDLEDISPQMAMAVIAAEDQQFPFHAGFDFKSIREAVRHNADSRRVRGASTISQQVAKNLFLWSGRSYLRKGLEAGLTVLIEWLWPKERILEMYLNLAQFGRGTYGVEAAAQRYFHKRAPAAAHRGGAAGCRAAQPGTHAGRGAVGLRTLAPGLDPGADGRPGRHRLPERTGGTER